jgi:hypothetical protein
MSINLKFVELAPGEIRTLTRLISLSRLFRVKNVFILIEVLLTYVRALSSS